MGAVNLAAPSSCFYGKRNMSTDKHIKRYFTLKEAAAYLGLTESALRTMVARRQIDFLKLGSRIRFDINDLDDVLVRYSCVNSIK